MRPIKLLLHDMRVDVWLLRRCWGRPCWQAATSHTWVPCRARTEKRCTRVCTCVCVCVVYGYMHHNLGAPLTCDAAPARAHALLELKI